MKSPFLTRRESSQRASSIAPEPQPPKETSRAWKLAIPFAVVTALIYAQGRAYYTGYIEHFSLEPSQLSLSSTDVYWEAFQGWMGLVTTSGPAVWRGYWGYLEKIWPMLALLAFMGLLLSLLEQADKSKSAGTPVTEQTESGFWNRSRPHLRRGISWLERTWKKCSPYFPTIWMPAILAALPLLYEVVMTTLAILMVFFVLMFENIGQQAAVIQCNKPAAYFPLVHFSGDERAGAGAFFR